MQKKTIEYRTIAESYFNKKLSEDECVHHINGNHTDNNRDNLVIMKISQHNRIHSLNNEWHIGQKKQCDCNKCTFIRLYENNINDTDVLFDLAKKSLFNLDKQKFDKHVFYTIFKQNSTNHTRGVQYE